jgi:hypothetical protein
MNITWIGPGSKVGLVCERTSCCNHVMRDQNMSLDQKYYDEYSCTVGYTVSKMHAFNSRFQQGRKILKRCMGHCYHNEWPRRGFGVTSSYVEWHFIVRHYKRCYIYVVRCNIIKILHSESTVFTVTWNWDFPFCSRAMRVQNKNLKVNHTA